MKKNNQPLILITNDDGINSPGIESLKNALTPLGEVVIVAPESQKSAVSSALTINKPLRVIPYKKNGNLFGYSVNGTPVDCVKIAISTLLDRKPDLVVSGINHGRNTSINVLYSGTVAGAAEGLIAGINSIAVSHASHNIESNLDGAEIFTHILARKLLNVSNKQKVLLNVNVPDLPSMKIKGVRLTKLSSSRWADKYEKRQDPFGNEYFWFAGEFITADNTPDTDDSAVNDGYISVSSVNFNMYDDSFNDFVELESLNHEYEDKYRRN
ncbi:MAG: 5'/3'-nucleotidase SurE [Candidatus Kapaibacterium sp.]